MRSWTGYLKSFRWPVGFSWRTALCFFFLCGEFILGSASFAAEPLDLVRLRDVICSPAIEADKSSHPEWSRGDHNARNPQSWGICQIQYRTAVGIGGLKWLERAGGFPAVFIVLGNADKAKDVALTILRWCAGVKGRRTVIGLAACYNAPGMAYPKPGSGALRDYVERVAAAYSEK